MPGSSEKSRIAYNLHLTNPLSIKLSAFCQCSIFVTNTAIFGRAKCRRHIHLDGATAFFEFEGGAGLKIHRIELQPRLSQLPNLIEALKQQQLMALLLRKTQMPPTYSQYSFQLPWKSAGQWRQWSDWYSY